jgi:hypothetical protein
MAATMQERGARRPAHTQVGMRFKNYEMAHLGGRVFDVADSLGSDLTFRIYHSIGIFGPCSARRRR